MATRIKRHHFKWEKIEKFFVVNALKDSKQELYLLLWPDINGKAVKIDFRFATSVIRSRAFFLREVHKLYTNVEFTAEDTLPKLASRPIRF